MIGETAPLIGKCFKEEVDYGAYTVAHYVMITGYPKLNANADGVGLAAPQVGLSLRLLVIDADVMGDDFPECKGFKRAMINPVFLEKSEEEVAMEEGCLSLPGVHEKVSRSIKVCVKYLDEDLIEHEETVEGFAARVVQHECEHLDGHVFIDNISGIRRQLNKSKLNSIIKGAARCSYKAKAVGK